MRNPFSKKTPPPSPSAQYLLSDARNALADDRLTLALESIGGLATSLAATGESEAAKQLAEEYGMPDGAAIYDVSCSFMPAFAVSLLLIFSQYGQEEFFLSS